MLPGVPVSLWGFKTCRVLPLFFLTSNQKPYLQTGLTSLPNHYWDCTLWVSWSLRPSKIALQAEIQKEVIHRLFTAFVSLFELGAEHQPWGSPAGPSAKLPGSLSERSSRNWQVNSSVIPAAAVYCASISCWVCIWLLNCHHNSVPEEVLSRPSEHHDEDKAAPICVAATDTATAKSGGAAPSVGHACADYYILFRWQETNI